MSLRFAKILVLAAFAAFASARALAAGNVAIVSKVDPEFPREAMVAGADTGRVKARLSIDSGGEVTRVEIVEANPRRLFDRAVVRSLSQWRFNAGDDARTYEIDIDFHR